MSLKSRLVTHDELCRDCQACTLACSLYHEGECSLSLARLRVSKDMENYRFSIVAAASVTIQIAWTPVLTRRCGSTWGVPAIFQKIVWPAASATACPYSAFVLRCTPGRYRSATCAPDAMKDPLRPGLSCGCHHRRSSGGNMMPEIASLPNADRVRDSARDDPAVPLGGYAGQILDVDLTAGRIATRPTLPYVADYLGGRAPAARIAWDEMPTGIDASDPAALIIITTGPLNGTLAPTTGRTVMASLSPRAYPRPWKTHLTLGGWFGPELKYAGFDAIVIRGAASPVRLEITDGKAKIVDAAELWGVMRVKRS
jgi:hypothetical protein